MVEKLDLSQCICDKPGWCPVFEKEMGTMPPNWKWCQDCSQHDREEHFERTRKSVTTLVQSTDLSGLSVIWPAFLPWRPTSSMPGLYPWLIWVRDVPRAFYRLPHIQVNITSFFICEDCIPSNKKSVNSSCRPQVRGSI